MTEFRSRRMVVKGDEAAVQAFADQYGWPGAASDPGETSWTARPGVRLQYVVDPLSLVEYVVVSGNEQSAVEEATRIVADNAPIWTLEDLLADVSDSPDRAVAITRAGVGAPDEYDERFFVCITGAMKDPDTAVREAALYATAYSAYPQFHDHLVEVAQTDPDPDRQEDADLILESFD
jgi:hypothetical protein